MMPNGSYFLWEADFLFEFFTWMDNSTATVKPMMAKNVNRLFQTSKTLFIY